MSLSNRDLYSASVYFTHGCVHISGTPIFVLAEIVDLEKKDGWLSTDCGEKLVATMTAAEKKQKG